MTASAFTWPPFTTGEMAATVSNMSEVTPPRRSGCARVLPLYGTCVIWMPVMDLNNSPDMCGAPPTPLDAKVSASGLARP